MFVNPETIDSDNDSNTPKPKQYDNHSTDDIFKCIFMTENFWIVKKISMTYFVLSGLIDNMATLQHWVREWLGAVQMTSHYLMQCVYVVLTHICVTQPQCVKASSASSHYLNQRCPIVSFILWNNFSEIWYEIQQFSLKKTNLNMSFAKRRPFCFGCSVPAKMTKVLVQIPLCLLLIDLHVKLSSDSHNAHV